MRIVLDTNVLIAAAISRGVCHKLLEYCLVEHTLITSDFVLGELRDKLVGKFGHSPDIVDQIVEVLAGHLELVVPSDVSGAVRRDPDDDNILGTALAGNCRLIISGDSDLLDLRKFDQIVIMSPREFLESEEVSGL